MRISKTALGTLAAAFVVGTVGCSDPVQPVASTSQVEAAPFLSRGGNPREQVWADGELFGTVVTPATFKPESGNFDELYAGATFRGGIGLISESKPGDRDYNGGRWHLNVLKPGVDPNKYASAYRVEDLDPNDFMPTSRYFECPLLPLQGG